MPRFALTPAVLVLLGIAIPADHASAQDSAATVETIVLLRHGEKPENGLGQLNCKGLNRALALPAVLSKRFGRPDAIFAANPSQQKRDGAASYDYVRPLATIEPTAIAFGLPVDTGFGLADTEGLRAALAQPGRSNSTVVVAWEHHQIEALARDLLKANGGDPDQVPSWPGEDFDSLYVIRIARSGSVATAAFEHAREGLDGQPTNCPG